MSKHENTGLNNPIGALVPWLMMIIVTIFYFYEGNTDYSGLTNSDQSISSAHDIRIKSKASSLPSQKRIELSQDKKDLANLIRSRAFNAVNSAASDGLFKSQFHIKNGIDSDIFSADELDAIRDDLVGRLTAQGYQVSCFLNSTFHQFNPCNVTW